MKVSTYMGEKYFNMIISDLLLESSISSSTLQNPCEIHTAHETQEDVGLARFSKPGSVGGKGVESPEYETRWRDRYDVHDG